MSTSDGAAEPALFGLIERLADNKYYLGRRYAEWCSGAPTLESGVAAAAMAQDELGHARAIYPLLRDLAPGGTDPREVDPDTRTHFINVAALDQEFGGWPDFVAANFLLDTAFSIVFEAALASSFEPLAARSRKVLQEERVHALHGEAWVRRLARGVPPVREALKAALLRMWDETLCWFGPPDEAGELAEAGVLDAFPDTLRARFLALVGPTIVTSGIALPARRTDDGEGWEVTSALPWAFWNARTYRLEARPAAAAQPGFSSSQRSDA
jgi:ring-1,2-phenylacetyl-CoA epoxidase subunit PaaC